MPQSQKTLTRCSWTDGSELYNTYHDEQWGVPVVDGRQLFAKLILDGAQAGLSWLTILKKTENYYRAFDNFNPEKIARYKDKDRDRLLSNAGIVRNRLKIDAAIHNARGYLRIVQREGSFAPYLWKFVDGKPIQNAWTSMDQIPTSTKESDAMSKALKKDGFKFVGTTICYAFMQATGMVNDHITTCFRYNKVKLVGESFSMS